MRSGGGDTSAPPPASIRETGGVGVRDRFVGPALLRSADAEPADARLFSLRAGGMPGRSSIITIGVGLTELFRIRVTRSFVTGPFLENSSLELTSPTCLIQDTRHGKADAREDVHERKRYIRAKADGNDSNTNRDTTRSQPKASAVNPTQATSTIYIANEILQHTLSSSSTSHCGWHQPNGRHPKYNSMLSKPPPAPQSQGLPWPSSGTTSKPKSLNRTSTTRSNALLHQPHSLTQSVYPPLIPPQPPLPTPPRCPPLTGRTLTHVLPTRR